MEIQLNTYHWYQVLYQTLNTSYIKNHVPFEVPCEPPIVVPSTVIISLPTIWLQIIAFDPPKSLINISHSSKYLLLVFIVLDISKRGINVTSPLPVPDSSLVAA